MPIKARSGQIDELRAFFITESEYNKMNTPYKESKVQRIWFKYGNTNGEKWGKHKKAINYHICVWHDGRYISCDYCTYLIVARRVRDNLQALNPHMNYVIIGNYGNFQALEKGVIL